MWPLVLGYHTKKRNSQRQAQTVPMRFFPSLSPTTWAAWGAALGATAVALGSQAKPSLLAAGLNSVGPVGTTASVLGVGLVGGSLCGAFSAKIITIWQARQQHRQWGLTPLPPTLKALQQWWSAQALGPETSCYHRTQQQWQALPSTATPVQRWACLLQWLPQAAAWQPTARWGQTRWHPHDPHLVLAQFLATTTDLDAPTRQALAMALRSWATPARLPLNAPALAHQLVQRLQHWAQTPSAPHTTPPALEALVPQWWVAAVQQMDFQATPATIEHAAVHLGDGVIGCTPAALGAALARFLPLGVLNPCSPLGPHHPQWAQVRRSLKAWLLPQWEDLTPVVDTGLYPVCLGPLGQTDLILFKIQRQQHPTWRAWVDQLPICAYPLLPVLRPQGMLKTFRQRAAQL